MTTEDRIQPNETAVPLLPCVAVDETLAFWRALGYAVTWEQRKPYLYLAFRFSGFELHYGRAASGLDPAAEQSGGCLVMVDAVAPYHAAFVAGMRGAYGKVLARGLPRITRYRPGASRFSVVDPSGNTITFIRRDEPAELDYGGSVRLSGLARVLDNARILREFKNDDKAAFRSLNSGLRRHGDDAPVVEQALALAGLVELATALGKLDVVPEWGERLRGLALTGPELERVRLSVAQPDVLAPWLPEAR
ncbi:glyoxalase [Micromonospora andamanensis]|uniref:Glyoxalase n=1 Tax=Micromonospora andamanensis TaxID=1287068 RepID=A0ABQ4HVV2_9ACTN|nr:glyoxalase [Micromonospora andamanensis]GIJ09788.1 hypothetical protein Van01_30020 [Micromonospora andamanensis]